MDRQTVTVTVYDAERYDEDFPQVDLGLAGFIKWLNGHLASIPEEFRESAAIEIDSVSGYEDCHYATITISYERPETDDEMLRREALAQSVKQARESRERSEFERLRAKFGP